MMKKLSLFFVIFSLLIPFALASSVSIAPDPADDGDSLICSIDSGTIGISYKWFKNNAETSITSSFVDASYTNPGDNWRCEIWKYYSYAGWVQLGEASVTIQSTPVSNNPPVLDSVGNKQTSEGQNLQFAVSGSDPDGDTLQFSTLDLPSGATFNQLSRTFSWTPNFDQAGSYQITFKVIDNRGGSDEETITISVADYQTESGTVVIAPKPANDNQDLTCNLNPQIIGATYKWFKNNAEVTSINGNFVSNAYTNAGDNWRCEAWKYYSYAGWVQFGEDSVSIDAAPRHAPVMNPIDNKSVKENQLLQFTVTASDADNDPLTFSASNLPSGAVFSSSGAFSWTPNINQAGNYQVTFTVTDNIDGSDSKTITISVGNENQAPVLQNPGNIEMNEGETKSITLQASDPDGDAITFSASNAPSFLSISGSNITLKPDFNSAGFYQVTFIAADSSGAQDQKSITITVKDAEAPITPPTTPPVTPPAAPAEEVKPDLKNPGNKQVAENDKLSFVLEATDPQNRAIAFSASNAPSFLSLNGNTITLSPGFNDMGSYVVSFTATAGTQSDTETITITVTNANRGPTITVPQNSYSLIVGQSLAITGITAADPDGDTLTLSALNLPPGAVFSASNNQGTFNWPVANIGTFNVVFSATDGSLSDSKTVAITVTSAPITPEQAPKKPILVKDIHIDGINYNEAVPAGSTVRFSTSVENTGKVDFEKTTFAVTIPELGIRRSTSFDFDSGDKERKSVTVEIPEDAEPGIYTVRFKIDNSQHHRYVHRDIIIE